MKRYFVILALILICQTGNSQTLNELFKEFSNLAAILPSLYAEERDRL